MIRRLLCESLVYSDRADSIGIKQGRSRTILIVFCLRPFSHSTYKTEKVRPKRRTLWMPALPSHGCTKPADSRLGISYPVLLSSTDTDVA